jgi:hypothetical protein
LGIVSDFSGNLYITGRYYGTVDFNPGPAIFNLISIGSEDIFICKLNNSGSFVWAKSVGGLGYDEATSITLDSSGYLVAAGIFQDTSDFDPGIGIFHLYPVNGNSLFVLKLDTAGTFVWAVQGGYNGYPFSIISDVIGNVYITGYYGNFGSEFLMLKKYTASGEPVWASFLVGGSLGGVYGRSSAIDKFGNIYTTGSFEGIVDFDGQIGGPGHLISNFTDIFLLKSDTSGNFIWVKSVGGPGDESGNSVVTDNSGNIYTKGWFFESGIIDFDPGSGSYSVVGSGANTVVEFLSKFDSSGNFMWVKPIYSNAAFYDLAGITIDMSDNIYIASNFKSSTISLNPFLLTNAGNNTYDLYLARLDNSATDILNVENNNAISFFPNPASNHFTIALGNNKKAEVNLTDITGKIIYSTTTKETKLEINTKDFAEGVYIVQVKWEEFVETKKVLITHQY